MSGEKKKESLIKRIVNNNTFRGTVLLGVMVLIFLTIVCGGAVLLFRPYTITLDLADGSEPMTESFDLNSGDIELGVPEREGYRFTGWTGSNGPKPQRGVVVKAGQLGDFSYTANWSDDLTVTCQDWIVDKDGTPIREVTGEVDKFLKDGNSAKGYAVKDRTIQVKPGTVVNGSSWGDDKSYKVYSDQYMYVGSSGDFTVNNDGGIVYRYFYPVFDVNYLIDNLDPSKYELANNDVAFFDLYVDGNLVLGDAYDCCLGVPYGSNFEAVAKNINPKFKYDEATVASGTMGDIRQNLYISFTNREGEFEVTCEDWLIDKDGNKIRQITDEIDAFLAAGSSKKKYTLLDRTVLVSSEDEVSGALWGSDTTISAYSDKYVYVNSSYPRTVKSNNTVVYRFFYPLLDVNADIDGNKAGNTGNLAKFNVYVDYELVAENVTDFFEGVPCNSQYQIEITEYINWAYVHKNTFADSASMGKYRRDLDLKFAERTGNSYVMIEDWLVDRNGNRTKEITSEVDGYLSAGSSLGKYFKQSRAIKVKMGETIDPALFGNDPEVGAYIEDYVYDSASEEVVIEGDVTVYRYFVAADDR